MKQELYGNPSSDDVLQGQYSSELQYDEMLGYLKAAVDEGAVTHSISTATEKKMAVISSLPSARMRHVLP